MTEIGVPGSKIKKEYSGETVKTEFHPGPDGKDYIAIYKYKDFALMCKLQYVKYLYAFGSSVPEDFDFAKIDIELLVQIESYDPVGRSAGYAKEKEELTAALY